MISQNDLSDQFKTLLIKGSSRSEQDEKFIPKWKNFIYNKNGQYYQNEIFSYKIFYNNTLASYLQRLLNIFFLHPLKISEHICFSDDLGGIKVERNEISREISQFRRFI